MADALPGAVAPIPAAVRAADLTQQATCAPDLRERMTRLLALADMARAQPLGEPDFPPGGDSTDSADKLAALLHCLTAELQSLHSVACGDVDGTQSQGAAA